MPNRMLRDWTDSDKVQGLTAQAERFFVRLIMKADDYGCYYADSRLLKSNLFPLSDGMRDADISRWLDECQKAGLIAVYESAGKRYLEIKEFKQRLRVKKRKFPAPPNMTGICPTSDRHAPDICPPEGEVEDEVEDEKEGEAAPMPDSGDSGLIYDIESDLTNNQKIFESICISAQKNPELGREVLKKYHLWNIENDKYPKTKKSLRGGFQRWLINEKTNGTHKQPTPGSNRQQGANQLVDSLRKDLESSAGGSYNS